MDTHRATHFEIRQAKKQGIFFGFLLGFLFFIFLGMVLTVFIWFNQDRVVEKTVDYFVVGFLQEIARTFPDAYMTYNGERVLRDLDNFVNEAASNRISQKDYKSIGKTIVIAVKDKRLTYQEMDSILTQMENVLNRIGNHSATGEN